MNKRRVQIVAEAGVNHNGSLETAKRLVEAAAAGGADAVKFQTFRAGALVARNAPLAPYQQAGKAPGDQYELLARLELATEQFMALNDFCKDYDIELLSTPFDADSVRFLTEQLRLKRLKISSGDATCAPLLLQMARTQLPLVLSTGMCTLGEVEQALAVLCFGWTSAADAVPDSDRLSAALSSAEGQRWLQERIVLLHTTTAYPTPPDEANLRVLDTLSAAFGVQVGYSDHTPGIEVALAAAACGAVLIEKHLTLDRTMPGVDQAASLEPHEFRHMVDGIRAVEAALGSPLKRPTAEERLNMLAARRSIVAACPIEAGEPFTANNLTWKRPGGGLSPHLYWQLLGKRARRPYRFDEQID